MRLQIIWPWIDKQRACHKISAKMTALPNPVTWEPLFLKRSCNTVRSACRYSRTKIALYDGAEAVRNVH